MSPAADEAATYLLQAREVVAGYGTSEVLHAISVDVCSGDAIGFVGPNGAGKTTLLKVLAGTLRCRRGDILFGRDVVTRWDAPRRVARGIVLVPEGREVFPMLSVAENLWLGGFSAPSAREESTETVYRLFPRLRERSDQLAGTLSGGEQQMVALARGLMAQPKLLMIDEPSLGLAPVLVESLIEQLKRIREELGVTMLIAEQGLSIAASVCDRLHVIAGGRAVAQVEPDLPEHELLALYMGETRGHAAAAGSYEVGERNEVL